jgi:translation initiation factor IF-3
LIALSIARNKDLDLVEIVPNAKPPVCKIIDFQKFLYEKKQKDREREKNQRKNASKKL